MSTEMVVLVHGIWMTGLDLFPLAKRLQGRGFETRIFRYPSLRRPPAANGEALAAFVRELDAPVVHLVGHSLGGIVILHALQADPDLPPGRVALVASPVQGSAVARVMSRWRLIAPWVLGRSTERGLLGDAPKTVSNREVLTISGGLPVGLGRVFADLPGPHDGTVSVSETKLRGVKARRVLPTTHTGVVLSSTTADLVSAFLRDGELP